MQRQTTKAIQPVQPNPIAPVKKKQKFHHPEPNFLLGLLGCFGGLFIQLVVGAIYQWGIINLYVTSYYRLTHDDSLTVESTGIAFPIMFLMVGLTMRFGLYLSNLTHPLLILSACKTLEALFMFLTSYMPDIWLFILFYGILFGLTAGTCFMIPITECNKYLVGKKMIVNGIILIGTGSGSMVFGMFSYFYLNPQQVPPLKGYYLGDPALQQIAMKCPSLMRWLALLYIIIGFAGIAMITPVCLRNRQADKQKEKHQLEKKLRREARAQKKRLKQLHPHNQNHTLQNYSDTMTLQSEQPTKNQNQLHNQSNKIQHQNHRKQSIDHSKKNDKAHELHEHDKNKKQNSIVPVNHQNSNQKLNQNPHQNQNQNTLTKKDEKPHEKHLTRHQRKHLHQAHSILQAAKTKIFWINVVIILLSATGCFLINGNFKTYVKAKISDDKFLTIVGVVGAIANGCSRFFWNLYFSKTGYKTVLLTILTLTIIVYSTIRFSINNYALYTIQIFVINCCLGGLLVLTPTSLLSIYGHTTGSNIYGVFWTVFGFANLIGYFYVSQLSLEIQFDNVIYVCLGMSCFAIPIVLLTKFQGPWQNDTSQLQYCVNHELQKKKQSLQNHTDVPHHANKHNTTNKNEHKNETPQNEGQDHLFIELKVSNSHKKQTKKQSEQILNETSEALNPSLPTKRKKLQKLDHEPKILPPITQMNVVQRQDRQ